MIPLESESQVMWGRRPWHMREVFDSLSAALLRSGRSLALPCSRPVMLYRSLLRPLLFKLPPETEHEFALHAPSHGLCTPDEFAPNDFSLKEEEHER